MTTAMTGQSLRELMLGNMVGQGITAAMVLIILASFKALFSTDKGKG